MSIVWQKFYNCWYISYAKYGDFKFYGVAKTILLSDVVKHLQIISPGTLE